MNNDRVNEAYYGVASGEETRRITQERIHWICRHVVGRRVLDLGCSQGIVTVLLARQGFHLTAVDKELSSLLYARREIGREDVPTRSRVELLLAEGERLPLPDDFYDTVVLGEVIEHVEAPRPLVEEIRRVLKPSGRLVLTTPFGLLPHEDHKRSFYVSSLLDALGPSFVSDVWSLQGHHYFRVRARSVEGGIGAMAPERSDLMVDQERRFLAKETSYVERQEELRSNLARANEKYREATERVENLKRIVHSLSDRELNADQQGTLDALTEESRQLEREAESLRGELEEERRRHRAVEERYYNAVRSFKKLKAEVKKSRRRAEEQQRQIAAMQQQVEDLKETARYRIGDAVVLASSSPHDLVRLPSRLWSIYRSRKAGRSIDEPIPAKVNEREVARRLVQFEREFERFVKHLQSSSPSHFVVMFGGTTYIQGVRANRPIRLTRAFLDKGVPVLFNFHRWRNSDYIPPYDLGRPDLFQSPTDLTPDLVLRILKDDLGGARRLFVVSYPHPSVVRLVPQLNVNGWATLYDCRDDWEEFEKVGAARWYREAVERFVVNHCDMTCCVSRPLQEKISSFSGRRPVRLSPNAFDPGFLSPGYRHAPGERVTIGYFGHLTESWFDWDSLGWIAKQRPEWLFQIIGHGGPDASTLNLPKNVELLGPRTHPEICEVAARWHAGIIPFKVSKLADGVDPIKIYEYFGLGLPVVSFRMPQIEDYPCTRTVETREEFLGALDRALEESCPEEVLTEFLQSNTWPLRAAQMLEWADEILDSPSLEKLLRIAG